MLDYSTFFIEGTKEAAFLNAIVSAGVAHSVTSACAKNNITDCICGMNKGPTTATQASWENHGCTNNIAHGIEISKTFLEGTPMTRSSMKKGYELQVKHNREAGRQVKMYINSALGK